MAVSQEDYDKYLKHILEDEAIWNSDDHFYDEFHTMLSRLKLDHRENDCEDIIREAIYKRRELVEKYRQEHPRGECRICEIDEDGNFTGNYIVVGEVCKL